MKYYYIQLKLSYCKKLYPIKNGWKIPKKIRDREKIISYYFVTEVVRSHAGESRLHWKAWLVCRVVARRTMVAIWPFMKRFARNKMIWSFVGLFGMLKKIVYLEKSEQNLQYLMKFQNSILLF